MKALSVVNDNALVYANFLVFVFREILSRVQKRCGFIGISNISLHFQLEARPYVFILGFIKLVSYLKNKRQNIEDHGNKEGFVKRVLFLGNLICGT